MIPAYVEAICNEIACVAQAWAVKPGLGPDQIPLFESTAPTPECIPAHTIFFGGGTPSLLSVAQIDQILSALRANFAVQADAEITLEANPGTVSEEYLRGLRRLGVNRISFGMQSAHPDDLRLLERQHDFFDVVQALQWARRAGFDNLSVDLIFGLPEQSLERWQETLKRAIELNTQHLSLYALTIEHGTPLFRRWSRGMIPLVDDDLAADMYEWAMDTLPQAGYEQYEISNFARRGPGGSLLASRHNLQYWRNQPYLGFGPGAHGYAAGFRTMNVGGIRPFIDRCNSDRCNSDRGSSDQPGNAFPCGPATRRAIPVTDREAMQETMMVGLRLTQEGVDAADFMKRFGQSLEEAFGPEIEHLLKIGLLEWTGLPEHRRLRLTRRGRLVGNQVFMQFVDN